MSYRFFLSSLIVIASAFNFPPLYAMTPDENKGASAAKKPRHGGKNIQLPGPSSDEEEPDHDHSETGLGAYSKGNKKKKVIVVEDSSESEPPTPAINDSPFSFVVPARRPSAVAQGSQFQYLPIPSSVQSYCDTCKVYHKAGMTSSNSQGTTLSSLPSRSISTDSVVSASSSMNAFPPSPRPSLSSVSSINFDYDPNLPSVIFSSDRSSIDDLSSMRSSILSDDEESNSSTMSSASRYEGERESELYRKYPKEDFPKILSSLNLDTEIDRELSLIWEDWYTSPWSQCLSDALIVLLEDLGGKIKSSPDKEKVKEELVAQICKNNDFKYFKGNYEFKNVIDILYKPSDIVAAARNVWFLLGLLKEIDQDSASLLESKLIASFLTPESSLPFLLHQKPEELWRDVERIKNEKSDIKDKVKKLSPLAYALTLKGDREKVFEQADACHAIVKREAEGGGTFEKGWPLYNNAVFAEVFFDAALMELAADRKEDSSSLEDAAFIQNCLIKKDNSAEEREVRYKKIIGYKDRIIGLFASSGV